MACIAAVGASMSASNSRRAGPCQASPSKARRSWSGRRADSLVALVDDDGDVGFVRGMSYSVAIQQQTFPGVDGEAGCPGFFHGFNRTDANHRNIEAHVLVWLGNFDNRERAAQGGGGAFQRLHELSSAFDGRIGAFHSFHSYAGSLGDHHRLSNVVLRDMAGNGAAIVDVPSFFLRGR